MSKLWIIGDSFTGAGEHPFRNWPELVCDKFKGNSYIVKSKPSRDFQTILDIFLRNLKNISKDDFVILTIPSLSRTRLPRFKPAWDVEHTNEKIKFQEEKEHFDYFIGAWSYHKEAIEMYNLLEQPLFELTHKECIRKTEISTIVNASNASKQNYIEILQSLKSYLPFEIFIWSWEDEIESEIITNKNEIKKQIGFWHTLYDLYKETNGEQGKLGDHHFSMKMHNAFAEYIINKFPEYFIK